MKKARRSKLMIQICENSRQEYEQKMRQRPLEVLAEERVLENGRYIYKGFSREYVSVSFVYGDDCRGRCVLCTPDMIV